MHHFTQSEHYKNRIEKIRDNHFIRLQERASQDRLDLIKTLTFKQKVEICRDLDLFEEEYLNDLIYDSSMTYDELLDEQLPF